MATITITLDRTSARPRTGLVIGRVPFALSLALALVSVAASAGALLFGDLLRGPAVSVGNLQGTALVLLVVTLPVLVASIALVARGVQLALLGWLGAVGSILYQSVLFVFATPFNAFFFLYVAMLSLSVWSLVALAPSIEPSQIGTRVRDGAPVRLVAGYLLANAALFLAMWLRATVPAVLSSAPPAFLEGTGMTTGPVQVLDLAFTLPTMALAAALLLRREAWGFVLTGALLVMLAIETASIGVDQWLGSAADPTSPASSASVTPVMAVLTVIGLVVLGLFLRPALRPSADG